MVTPEQIPIADSQETRKRESEHLNTDDDQFTKAHSKRVKMKKGELQNS